MFISCIRGAITVENNDKDEILKSTELLLTQIINQNNLNINDIIAILFTATNDLDEVYPAVAARNLNITKAALMCTQEMYVKDSLKKCIRVMVQVQSDITNESLKHVYLRDAVNLRPDLTH